MLVASMSVLRMCGIGKLYGQGKGVGGGKPSNSGGLCLSDFSSDTVHCDQKRRGRAAKAHRHGAWNTVTGGF